jgi:hypothetical protein
MMSHLPQNQSYKTRGSECILFLRPMEQERQTIMKRDLKKTKWMDCDRYRKVESNCMELLLVEGQCSLKRKEKQILIVKIEVSCIAP